MNALDSAPLPVLYSFRRCPYAMRARLALAVSGSQVELREVLLREKPPELLEVSPKGTVPVLVLPDQVLEHSLDIMLWALQRNDAEQWLRPEHADLETMLELIAECDNSFKPQLDRYKYPERYAGVDAVHHRDVGAQWLQGLEQRLQRHGGYLFGSRAALADWAIGPFVRQFAHTDIEWFAAQPWPRLLSWLQGLLESALFDRIMGKYPRWKSGAPGEAFPPAIGMSVGQLGR